MTAILRRLPALVAATVLMTGVSLLVNGTAHAQTPINPILPTKGTKEVFLNGNLIFQPGSSQDVSLGYGPFLNNNLQVGVMGNYTNPDEGKSFYDVSGFANYHFPGKSALLPFVGVNLGYTDPGVGDGSVIYGVQGGAKYFVNPNVSVNGTLLYRNFEKSNYKDDFRLTFGVSAYLR